MGSSVVQTNLAQKQNTQTSSKANQSDKSSQTNQTSKSSLPNTGEVSSLGLGALGAVLMTTSFALKGQGKSQNKIKRTVVICLSGVNYCSFSISFHDYMRMNKNKYKF